MSKSDISYPFADVELARRLERAEARGNAGFVEARAKAFPDLGAEWMEVAGAFAMFDGPGSPVTQTFGLGMFEPHDSESAAQRRAVCATGRTFAIWRDPRLYDRDDGGPTGQRLTAQRRAPRISHRLHTNKVAAVDMMYMIFKITNHQK